MDVRPPPEVTIEGGPGRRLGGGLGPDDPTPRGRTSWLRRHRTAWVALAALGGLLATAPDGLRGTTPGDSPESVLSLEERLDQPDSGGVGVLSDDDGLSLLTTTVVIQNTGPRVVTLQRAELLSTSYRTEQVQGRRVPAGGQAAITLLRPVDCTQLADTSAPGPLRVQATTGAGTRTVDLRIDIAVVAFHDEQARASCGQSEPDEALLLSLRGAVLDGTTLRLALGLSNGSALPLAVESLTPPRGLRLGRVSARDGTRPDAAFAPLVLPLPLTPGDFDPPVEPREGRGPEVELAVEVEVADCAGYRPPSSEEFEPAVSFLVTGAVGVSGIGTNPALLQGLHRTSCPGVAVAPG